MRNRILGSEHPDTLSAMNNLAATYSDLGRDTEAIALMQQVYEARCRGFGKGHKTTQKAYELLEAFKQHFSSDN